MSRLSSAAPKSNALYKALSGSYRAARETESKLATVAGARFGTALLWALLFSTLATMARYRPPNLLPLRRLPQRPRLQAPRSQRLLRQGSLRQRLVTAR